MSTNLRRAGALALALLLSACADATAPVGNAASRGPAVPLLARVIDTTVTAGTGVGGAGGGASGAGGNSSSSGGCGTLANIHTVDISVYTTRTGIGVAGIATNCGTHREALQVDVTDENSDPACQVDMPHFIAVRNTDPGSSISWEVNSTLVRCQNQLHFFDVRLWDTKTGETLSTGTAFAFL